MPAPPAPLLVDLLREALARGEPVSLVVASDSMRPLLRRGDRVIIAPVVAADLERGDLVTLHDGSPSGSLLTHRYYGQIASVPPLLVTRGDRVLRFDAPASPERLIGRVLARQRGGHTLSLLGGPGAALNSRLGALACDEVRRVTGRALSVSMDKTEYDTLAALAAANAGRLSVRIYRRWLRWRAAGLARGARGVPDDAARSLELKEAHV